MLQKDGIYANPSLHASQKGNRKAEPADSIESMDFHNRKINPPTIPLKGRSRKLEGLDSIESFSSDPPKKKSQSGRSDLQSLSENVLEHSKSNLHSHKKRQQRLLTSRSKYYTSSYPKYMGSGRNLVMKRGEKQISNGVLSY